MHVRISPRCGGEWGTPADFQRTHAEGEHEVNNIDATPLPSGRTRGSGSAAQCRVEVTETQCEKGEGSDEEGGFAKSKPKTNNQAVPSYKNGKKMGRQEMTTIANYDAIGKLPFSFSVRFHVVGMQVARLTSDVSLGWLN